MEDVWHRAHDVSNGGQKLISGLVKNESPALMRFSAKSSTICSSSGDRAAGHSFQRRIDNCQSGRERSKVRRFDRQSFLTEGHCIGRQLSKQRFGNIDRHPRQAA